MDLKVKEILNLKLIPDLVSIITDYTLTPYEYFKLIDNKKYTDDEYQKFEKEYIIKIAETIYQEWKLDLEIANSKVKKPINLKFFDFKSSRLSLLDKYIPIFITEFKNANVVEIKKFKKVSDYVYKIYGNLLDRWLLSLDGDVSFDVTII